ncbi:hypothetical protein [Mesoaciditoga lauensis]|uniref:hypothetical protein n=1 Tax=Mesoaciditoga lauensis TaxID=1495039 RepID=UPI00056C97F7|nr:hypothetical protein [Mesoaciditoga lauensis]
MVPNLFLLIYAVSAYAFSNNSLVYANNKKEIQKASIWIVLISLSLTFDLLTNWVGLLSVFVFTAFLILTTFAKSKKDKMSWYLTWELINVGVALAFTLPLSGWLSSDSYLRPPFVNYLLGLTIASVVFADIFRRVGIIPKDSGDSDGDFERILLFIFIMAGQLWYTLLTIAGMLIYRFLRYKKPSVMWILSPAVGVLFSLFWYLLMNFEWI